MILTDIMVTWAVLTTLTMTMPLLHPVVSLVRWQPCATRLVGCC
jgi:hypothetical protein